jgi:large exoprotein involved in heme utilization and adhesion
VRDRLFATKGVISTETTNGNGGTVNLVAGDLELRDQSLISTASMGAGKAGNVMIRSGQVNLNDSQITSRSRGFGDGGSIDLTAQTLRLNRNSTLNAQTTSGNGGNLDLKLTDLLQLRDRSLLSAAAGGNGNGGNIRLSAPFIVGFEDSDIVANAFEGRGGNIQITADGIFGLKYRTERTAGNDITASSLFGVNGDVQIQILSIDSTSSLGLLPIDGVDRSRQVDRQCSSGQSSSFVTTGRSGLPETPVQRLQLAALWQDNRAASVSSFAPMARSIQSVAEATDWQQGANGAVELVARSNGVRSGFQANCATVK